MIERKPAGYWTRERVIELAKTCKTKSELQKANSTAYKKALDEDLFKEFHWMKMRKPSENKKLKEYNQRYYQKRKRRYALGITSDMQNEHEFKVTMPQPDIRPDTSPVLLKIELRSAGDYIAMESQKAIRKEWAHKGYKNNIIIINSGALSYVRKTIKYLCEIHQMRMTSAIRDEFEALCKDVIERINNMNKDKIYGNQ